eukprot:1378152-Amorphochlora_amoeboformis.AAC.2
MPSPTRRSRSSTDGTPLGPTSPEFSRNTAEIKINYKWWIASALLILSVRTLWDLFQHIDIYIHTT